METLRKGKCLQFQLPDQWNLLSIDQILRNHWSVPKKLLHQLRMDKAVMINGVKISWNQSLRSGDLFEIELFNEEEFGVIPQNLSVEVLYEDDHLIVVNKQAGIETHPNTEGQIGTLANGVAYYFQQKGEKIRVRHIHRLDKDTSGAVLFAKHAISHSILDRMLDQREIKRNYLALAQGMIKEKSVVIDQPIGKDRHHATRRRVSNSGQKALTRVQVLKVLKQDKLSLVECTLDTGRTHQIRVHLSWLGHPLAGDTLYGGKPIFPRQALHARKLTLVHPFTKESITCIAPFNDPKPIFEKYMG